jgi:protein subunit release factor A
MWPNTVTKKDLKIYYYNGSGAGGTNRNKNKNCVRMTHIPTGTQSQCQDFRSRDQNLRTAFRRLADKLVPMMKREVTRERFAAGTERVRTYHEPRNVVKDERVPDKTYSYEDVLHGDGLRELLGDLNEHRISSRAELDE